MLKNKNFKIILYVFAISVLISSVGIYNTEAKDTVNKTYPEYLIPGGEVIGIKLYTNGVHVVDTGYIDTVDGRKSPANDAGIKSGDFITEINNSRVDTIEDFTNHIQSNNPIDIVYYRKNKKKHTTLKPALSSVDNSFKAGMWIRDSTAGIGTLTFYDPVTKKFGALGHGINDHDTGKLLTLKKGKIYKTHLTSVVKAENGEPGEINGTFIGNNNNIGIMKLNTKRGIYGTLDEPINLNKPLKVAKTDEIETGKATILCTVENNKVSEYEIEIINIIKNSPFKNEGLTIKITDKKLLEQEASCRE